MGVSRATLARVLARARRAVADALVHRKALAVGGGVVRRGSERPRPCPVHGGRRRRGRGCHCGGGHGRGRGRGRGRGGGHGRGHGRGRGQGRGRWRTDNPPDPPAANEE
jgi:hypothetical protein